MTRDQLDRAREWVNENHPEAEGDDWEELFIAAQLDIVAIDAAADRCVSCGAVNGCDPGCTYPDGVWGSDD